MDPIHFTAARSISRGRARQEADDFYETHGATVMRLHLDARKWLRAFAALAGKALARLAVTAGVRTSPLVVNSQA